MHAHSIRSTGLPAAPAAVAATPASRRIAAFASQFDPTQLDDTLRREVARSWLDTACVALAGWREAASQRALAYAAAQFGLDTRRAANRARVWGRADATALEAAALVNGVAGHVLDYDDVTTPMRGHPSIALWPALNALADARDLPGARVASAFVVGFEVICKLSHAMAQRHYARGWHSTLSIGVLGTTAAASHLLSFDEARSVNALGLAVAMSAGSRQNFGSDAKAFQAGQCGAAALRAVLLAEAGLDAAADAIDGEFGWQALVGHGEDLAPMLATLRREPLELASSGIEIKQYPMCYAAHRTIDAVLALRRVHGLRLDDVQAVEVLTSRGAQVPLIHHRPSTGLQAKFSMEYAVSVALAEGQVQLAHFDDAVVTRADLQAFLPRVRAREAIEGGLDPRFAEVSMRLRDGRLLQQRVQTQHGAAEDPLNDDELLAKATDCLRHGGCRADARRVFDAALAMHQRPARALLDALQDAA
jgi:2-methylcitrate dehydratase PrpD